MDDKRLKAEYKRWKQQEAPDLWNRIEANLKEHPERETGKECVETVHPFRRGRRVYRTAAAAVAVLALAVVLPNMAREKSAVTENMMQDRGGSDEGSPKDGLALEETDAGMAENTAAAGGAGVAEDEAAGADMAETAAAEEQKTGTGMAETAAAEEQKTGTGMAETVQEAQKPEGDGGEYAARTEENGGMPAKSGEAARDPSVNGQKNMGVVDSRQLTLAVSQPVAVPEDAVTVAADTLYFSEDILRDAGMLCGGTVTGVSLETDGSGRAVKVVYELALEQVYYAEDYIAGGDTITVKSPIVKTDGDEAYILYQLQPQGTYLLPLVKQEEGWELLYPFAPQIQVTGEGAYLFHSGYASLVNDETLVVTGSQEGSNDYYYDRMVLRQDEDFLFDLLTLVEH